jgi:hypothetical protein
MDKKVERRVYKQNQQVGFRFAEIASLRVGGSSFQP